MHRPTPSLLLALLVLPLGACDSSEDTGLAACSFSYTATGAFTDAVSGRSYFTRNANTGDPTTTYAVEMRPNVVNGSLAAISLVGIVPGTLAQKTYPIEGPGPGGDETMGYWFGSATVQGGDGLQSIGGSMSIITATEDRVEGRFTMEAENDVGGRTTIEGRFNASLFELGSACVLRAA